MTYRSLTPAVLLNLLALAGCAGDLPFRDGLRADEAQKLIASGHADEGIAQLEAVSRRHPEDLGYRTSLLRAKESRVQSLLKEADDARAAGDSKTASEHYLSVLSLSPGDQRAAGGIRQIEREGAHAALLAQAQAAFASGDMRGARGALNEILRENSGNRQAIALARQIETRQNRETLGSISLNNSLKKPISLDFRNVPLQSIFDMISHTADVNFIFDRDVKPDLRATIYARDTTVEDAIKLLLSTNQLDRKLLNDNTLLIYPNTSVKQKDYQELVVKSFYLSNADAKQALNQIKSMVKTRDIFVDDKLNMITLRDTPDAIAVAERLIQSQDLAEAEVLLDVEVLEVSADRLYNIGVQTPDQISASIVGQAASTSGQAVPGVINYQEARHFNSGLVKLNIGDPALVLNLKSTDGSANTLANPRIRVRSREKAKIHIGDKVPVITTTTNQTSGSIAESVNYLDTGVQLEVEPQVYLNNDVGIKVNLEVSSIAKEVTSKSGLLAYQIGSRQAQTVLRLKDGETQVLAGLIQNSETESASHIPLIGNLPVLGRLFSSQNNRRNKTEVVLLITPHVVRNLIQPDAYATEFASGTDSMVSITPLQLRRGSKLLVQTSGGEAGMAAATQPGPVPVLSASGGSTGSGTSGTTAPLAAGPLRFTLDGPDSASEGEEFRVTLQAAADMRLTSLSADIDYDASALQLISTRPAPFLMGGLRGNFNASPSDGRVHIEAKRASGFQGSGPAVTFTFRAKRNVQSSAIRIASVKASDTSGRDYTQSRGDTSAQAAQ